MLVCFSIIFQLFSPVFEQCVATANQRSKKRDFLIILYIFFELLFNGLECRLDMFDAKALLTKIIGCIRRVLQT